MTIRLYDSAWVAVEGVERPLQVVKDTRNPAAFNVGNFQYDIDGYPLRPEDTAPRITKLHTLQSAREAGLSTEYRRDAEPRLDQV
jgi:hypothetical protein